jgi:hypothetical protein
MWTGLIFVQNVDIYPIYFAFLLSLLGLLLLYLFPYKQLFIKIYDDRIMLSLYVPKFKNLTSYELENLKEEIECLV